MKIIRYQTGGIYYTPFFRDSINSGESQPIETKRAPKEDKDDQLIQKEIIGVLKENGLPNDVDYFLSKANTFLSQSQNLGFSFGLDSSSNTSYNTSGLIQLLSLANRTKHNNKLYEKAITQLDQEGSGSEVAITNTGSLYVLDKKGVKTIDPNTYYKNKDKYRILTNSELISLRENMPQLAYNSSILTDLSNSVGMKSIIDYVKSTIGSFGTNKVQNSKEYYTTKQKDKIEKGFETLLGLDSPDGVYRASISSEISNTGYNSNDEKGESLRYAVNYLYRALPANMKNVLRATATAEGLNPNDINDVKSLLVMAMTEHTQHSNTYQQTLRHVDDLLNGSGSGSSGGGSKGAKVELTREEMIGQGRGPVHITETILASSKNKGGLKLKTMSYGAPMDKDLKQIGMNTLDTILEQDRVFGSADRSSISFGDHLLSELDIKRVLYDGTSNITRAELPIKLDVYNSTGKIIPDLDAADRLEKFKKWYNNTNPTLSNVIQQKLNSMQLQNVYLDPNTKEWKFRNSKLFYIINGYASDKAVGFDDNSGWVSKVDSSQASRIYDLYENYVNYGSGTRKKSDKRDNFSGGWFGIGNPGSMYKSAVFIPVIDPGINTVTTNGERTSQDNYVDMFNKTNTSEMRRSIPTNF